MCGFFIQILAATLVGMILTPEILNSLSPYRTQHISRFGTYELRERDVPAVNYSLRFTARSPR